MAWHELVLTVLMQPVFIINLSYKYPSKKDLSRVVDASKACMYVSKYAIQKNAASQFEW